MFNNISICIERMDFSRPSSGQAVQFRGECGVDSAHAPFSFLTVLVFLTYQIYRNTSRIIMEIPSCPSLRFQKC